MCRESSKNTAQVLFPFVRMVCARRFLGRAHTRNSAHVCIIYLGTSHRVASAGSWAWSPALGSFALARARPARRTPCTFWRPTYRLRRHDCRLGRDPTMRLNEPESAASGSSCWKTWQLQSKSSSCIWSTRVHSGRRDAITTNSTCSALAVSLIIDLSQHSMAAWGLHLRSLLLLVIVEGRS